MAIKGNAKIFVLITLTVFFLSACTEKQENSNSFVDELLSKMTLQEKIGQLNQLSIGQDWTGPNTGVKASEEMMEDVKAGRVGSVINTTGVNKVREMQRLAVEGSRLHIPLVFAYDVIHGYKTSFPIPMAEACSWDLDLMEATARVAAKEAAVSGLNWTFAPMVDISYDARWGRVMEGAGEDTYLGTLAAIARVRGFQGNNLANEFTLAACAKHYAAYGFAEAGKDYNTVQMGMNALNNVVLPPFKACAKAGVATFMNSFNEIDGIPSTANHYLLREKLKGEWAFSGVVVSDWNSISEMVEHGYAVDNKHAAELAMKAGCDVDMMAYGYVNHLESLVKEGKISIKLIDDAVRRLLTLKYELGLFDNPYKYCNNAREKEFVFHPDHVKLSKKAALKSMVLLKNDPIPGQNRKILPLKGTERVALIGPFANSQGVHLSNWRAQAVPDSVVTIYAALKKQLGSQLYFSKGCEFEPRTDARYVNYKLTRKDKVDINKAVQIAKNADVVVMVLGETRDLVGEGYSRAFIELPTLQQELLRAVYKVNKNIVLLLASGRPLAIQWEVDNIPAILAIWHSGQQAGSAVADILLGKYNPSGKTVMTWPRYSGQCPVHYNYKPTGRPVFSKGLHTSHTDVPDSLLIPFGFGLSYTQFAYSDPEISSPVLEKGGKLLVKVNVTNTGQMAGTETVQLYIRDKTASVTRPIKELRDFKQIKLQPGETKQVVLTITEEKLKFYNNKLEFVSEPGDFIVYVGSDSGNNQKLAFKLN